MSLGDEIMSLPRYLYMPLCIQIAAEVVARLASDSVPVGPTLMILTLSLCIDLVARAALAGGHVFSGALWSVPLTFLAFINGSLGFAPSAAGYDPNAYLGFVFASILFTVAGIVAGLVGGIAARIFGRARRIAT